MSGIDYSLHLLSYIIREVNKPFSELEFCYFTLYKYDKGPEIKRKYIGKDFVQPNGPIDFLKREPVL